MRYTALAACFAACLPLTSSAQLQLEQTQTLEIDQQGDVTIEWDGFLNRSYFMQYSHDLVSWQYFPVIEKGQGSPLAYSFNSTAPEMFVRLQYKDGEFYSASSADFDGDGVENAIELMLGTQPFNPDSDGDGIPDGGDPNPLAAGDIEALPNNITLETRGETLVIPTATGAVGVPDYGYYSASWQADALGATLQEQIKVEEDGSLSSWSYKVDATGNADPFELEEQPSHGGPAFGSWPQVDEMAVAPEKHGWDRPFDSHLMGNGSLAPTGVPFSAAWQEAIPGWHRSGWSQRQLRLKADFPVQEKVTWNFLKVKESIHKYIDGNGSEAETRDIKVLEPLELSIEQGETKSDVLTLGYPTGATVTVQSDGSVHEAKAEAEKLVQVKVIIPTIDEQGNQVDGEFTDANELRVAKWETAFLGDSNNGQVRADFIDWDKDRFYILIPDAVTLGITSLEISTENPDATYNDDPTEIDVVDVGDGKTGITRAMILVADDVDDDFAGSGAGADDQKNDGSHKIQLGGKLVIKSLTVKGQKTNMGFKIPVPAKRQIDVDVYRMDVAGVHSVADIEKSMEKTQELYAQAGLKINYNIRQKEWPNNIGLSTNPGFLDLFDETNPQGTGPLTQDYKTFINHFDNQGTNIFFVKSAFGSKGIAITPKQLLYETSGSLDLKYTSKAFINSGHFGSLKPGDTPAHELMHCLAYEADKHDHVQVYYNLLSVDNDNTELVLYPKRINEDQQKKIYSHENVHPIN